MTRDKNGFVSVDLRNVGYKTAPFVLAKDVLQVFYVPDTVRTTQHIVLPGKRRIVGVHNAVDEEEFNQFDEIPPFATCECWQSLALQINLQAYGYRCSFHLVVFQGVESTRNEKCTSSVSCLSRGYDGSEDVQIR